MTYKLIQESNQAYYESSDPILTDREFDLLADNGLDMDSRNFRTKVKHTIPMGSLAKVKTEAELNTWLAKFPGHTIVVMPKLDGASIALTYHNGNLERAVTRGDGVDGNLITDNIMKTRVMQLLPGCTLSMEARAEAIIPKRFATQFEKNLRNTVAGMICAKDTRDELAMVDLVIFDLYGDGFMSWNEKKQALALFPQTVAYFELPVHDVNHDALVSLYYHLQSQYPYAIDGLVLHAIKDPDAPLAIPELMPVDKIAVKFQDPSVSAAIDHIEWFQGKHGKLAPVLVLAQGGVEIDSTTVQRISASNYSLLKAAGLGVGAQIQVIKANQIIPYVSAVDQRSMIGIEDLPFCPDCGEQSVWNNTQVDALCVNPDCQGKTIIILQKQIECFGIDFVSDSTIEKLVDAGHDTLEKLFALEIETMAAIDGFGERSAQWFIGNLHTTPITEAKVFKMVGLRGLGERKGTMLLNHYGSLQNMINSIYRDGQLANIPGFGDIQESVIVANLELLIMLRDRLAALGVTIIPHQKKATIVKNVCATGTCPGMARKDLEVMLKQMGYNLLFGVTKDCTLLLCEDPNGNSSKLQAARKLGIKIQSYQDFLREQRV